jgi:hypothetical protein
MDIFNSYVTNYQRVGDLEDAETNGSGARKRHRFLTYPLVMTNIAMGNGPFIDGLPIKKQM